MPLATSTTLILAFQTVKVFNLRNMNQVEDQIL